MMFVKVTAVSRSARLHYEQSELRRSMTLGLMGYSVPANAKQINASVLAGGVEDSCLTILDYNCSVRHEHFLQLLFTCRSGLKHEVDRAEYKSAEHRDSLNNTRIMDTIPEPC